VAVAVATPLRQYFLWLPADIAWVMVVQFLTLIPGALALRGWLPPTRSVRLATAAASGAMLAVGVCCLACLCYTWRRTSGHWMVGPPGVAVGSGPTGLQQVTIT